MITYFFTLIVYFNYYRDFIIVQDEYCDCNEDFNCDENNRKYILPCLELV